MGNLSKNKSILDSINRHGYEWFMNCLIHPKASYQRYQMKYQGDKSISRFVWGVTWRFTLMVIPVLPALYVGSRLFGVILNPWAWKKNPTKAMSMFGALITAAIGLSVPLMKYLVNPGFSGVSTTVFSTLVGSSLAMPLMVGVLTVGTLYLGAGLLYAAKYIAQALNASDKDTQLKSALGQPLGLTTPKYLVDNPLTSFQTTLLPEACLDFQKQVQASHKRLKNRLESSPDDLLRINQIDQKAPWVNDVACKNSVEAAEQTVLLGKQLLNESTALMQKQVDGLEITKAEYDMVFKTHFLQWENSISRVAPQNNMVPEPGFTYDSTNKRIVLKAS